MYTVHTCDATRVSKCEVIKPKKNKHFFVFADYLSHFCLISTQKTGGDNIHRWTFKVLAILLSVSTLHSLSQVNVESVCEHPEEPI